MGSKCMVADACCTTVGSMPAVTAVLFRVAPIEKTSRPACLELKCGPSPGCYLSVEHTGGKAGIMWGCSSLGETSQAESACV